MASYDRNAGMTRSAHSRMKRTLSSKWTLIQELAGAGVHGTLELSDAVVSRARDGEAVGQVVDEPELSNQLAIGAVRLVVLVEMVAGAERADLRHQLRRDVLALGREASEMAARPRRATSGCDRPPRAGVLGQAGQRQPPEIDLGGVPASTSSAPIRTCAIESRMISGSRPVLITTPSAIWWPGGASSGRGGNVERDVGPPPGQSGGATLVLGRAVAEQARRASRYSRISASVEPFRPML